MPIDQRSFDGLSRKLKRLGAKTGGKFLRAAAMSATLPVLKAARANIPKSAGSELHKTYKGRLVAPGFASRSVARKSIISRDKSFVRVMIGVRPEAFYAAIFVELGTARQAAQPWLEPALRNTKGEVVRRLASRLKSKIMAEARRR